MFSFAVLLLLLLPNPLCESPTTRERERGTSRRREGSGIPRSCPLIRQIAWICPATAEKSARVDAGRHLQAASAATEENRHAARVQERE